MLFRLRTLLILFSLAAPASADITDLSANAYTDNRESGSQQLYIWVSFEHTRLRSPDAISMLRVIAPDRTIINLVDGAWEEYWKGFGAYLQPADFDTGIIPSGNYRFQVREKGSAQHITIDDNVNANTFLPPPSVTSPSAGEQVGSLNPTITWTPVAGAKHYRLELNNDSWGEPLYGQGRNLNIIGGSTSFTIPKGVLRPGFDYSVRIRARDAVGWSEMDKQSRSNWVNFTTAP